MCRATWCQPRAAADGAPPVWNRGPFIQKKIYSNGGTAIWGGGAVDAGYVDAFLAAALTRVMRAVVPIPAVAAASVLHSAAVGGSDVGVVGPLSAFGELNSCELGVFRF